MRYTYEVTVEHAGAVPMGAHEDVARVVAEALARAGYSCAQVVVRVMAFDVTPARRRVS